VKSPRLDEALLLDAQYGFHELLQLLGEASSQIKEAYGDSSMGNIQGAVIVADDVISTLSELEAKVSHVAATVAKWKGWAEDYIENAPKGKLNAARLDAECQKWVKGGAK
jgi:hypothetical protein